MIMVMTEAGLTAAFLNIHGSTPADQCTDPSNWGCERQGGPSNVLNPIRSARLRSADSFNFVYGRVEIRAQLPVGDWIWPAIWMMPTVHQYGTWPVSGEIDIMESRGNRALMAGGVNIGVEQVGQTLHFGPYVALNSWEFAHGSQNNPTGFHNGMHTYGMEWTPELLRFTINGVTTTTVRGPFWELGEYDRRAPGTHNPWATTAHNSQMAPFDVPFYFIMNVAVGGTAYFPDGTTNPGGKPWSNNSPQAATDFWNGRNQWLPTWNMAPNNFERCMKVDYIRVWAL